MQGLNAPSCGAEQTATEAAVFPSLSGFSPIQANDALRLDCRNAKPNPAEPSNIVAQVDGSGTAEVSVDITEQHVGLPGLRGRSSRTCLGLPR